MTERRTKDCLSCRHLFPLTPKYWHRQRSSADGFQGRCKGCNTAQVREWQEKNPERYLRAQRERVRAPNPVRAEMIEYKESHACADCGLFFPYVAMSFDHLPDTDKANDVSRMAKATGLRGHDRLIAEIAKCDLVCLNCHALRTHERWLASKALSEDPPKRRVFRRAGHTPFVSIP